MIEAVKEEIRSQADPIKAKNSAWFFRSGPGQYGEGDKFLGLTTPQLRAIAVKYKNLPLSQVAQLLQSPYHEERSLGVLILVLQYPKNPPQVYNFYLTHLGGINNWDLVDISAPKIIGEYLRGKSWQILKKLAKSDNIWERRISIISTFNFICHGDPHPTLVISEILLSDKQDIIHKAVGWMLRELGKRCSQIREEEFIKKHYSQLSRTTLRYAIERFPKPLYQQYFRGQI